MKKSTDKSKEEFPGYPHYPESEDITASEKKLDVDPDTINPKDTGIREAKRNPPSPDYTPEIVTGTSADVTEEDLRNLGPLNNDMDEGEDETLLPLVKIGPDFTGDDLDVPGSELDDEDEERGSEDEENNYYSRGQD